MAITPGGRVGDASPLGKGPRKLSDYERELAHALLRKGVRPKSRAIAMARGIIDRAAKTGRWGRGKKASPNVIAGAQASVAQRKSFSAGHKLSNEHHYTHGWKLIDANHADVASKMTTTNEAQAALTHHDARMTATRGATREKHRAAARIYKARRDDIVAAKKRRGEQGTLFAESGATISTMTSSRELLLSEAAERGMIDLGMDGAKWKHGYIPLNAIAAAIKAKKWHGHGGKSTPNAPSGKSRLNVGSQAEHALAPKGKSKMTAAQRLRGEQARRKDRVDGRFNPNRPGAKEGHRERPTIDQGNTAGQRAAAALQAEHDRRTAKALTDKQQSEKFPEIRAKSTEDLSAMIQGKTAHDDEQVGVARAELARRNRAAEAANAEKLKGGSTGSTAFVARTLGVPPSEVMHEGGNKFSHKGTMHEMIPVRGGTHKVVPGPSHGLKVGDKVTNSAGQKLTVTQVHGDNIGVRFPSGMGAEVSAKSVSKPGDTPGKVTLTGNERYNLTTGERIPDESHPYPVGSVVTTNHRGNKVRARVILHDSYGSGTMTVHAMAPNGTATVKRSITTVRPQRYSEVGGLIHDSRGVQLGSIKRADGGHKATFRDGSDAGTHPTRAHALAALENKQHEHEKAQAVTDSEKAKLDRARASSYAGNISGRQAALTRAQQVAQDRHRANEAKVTGSAEREALASHSTADLMRQLNSSKTPPSLKALIQLVLEQCRRKQR